VPILIQPDSVTEADPLLSRLTATKLQLDRLGVGAGYLTDPSFDASVLPDGQRPPGASDDDDDSGGGGGGGYVYDDAAGSDDYLAVSSDAPNPVAVLLVVLVIGYLVTR
jgi:hypothetical protein